ncbi:MAG: hypothetical protein DMG83_00625 [Acidobacteria bacterium]|nr:MAG: hypothetical protein DMG83_00625 [Acidobacteriota bacterium]
MIPAMRDLRKPSAPSRKTGQNPAQSVLVKKGLRYSRRNSCLFNAQIFATVEFENDESECSHQV